MSIFQEKWKNPEVGEKKFILLKNSIFEFLLVNIENLFTANENTLVNLS